MDKPVNTSTGTQDWEHRRVLWAHNLKPLKQKNDRQSTPQPTYDHDMLHVHSSDVRKICPSSFAITLALVVLLGCGAYLFLELMENETRILRAYRDEVGRVDFAAPYNHATLISGLTSQTPPQKSTMNNTRYIHKENHPSVALGARNLDPGVCWRVEGGTGQMAIQFAMPVRITHVTVDHIPSGLVSSVLNAPRRIRVWGLLANSLEHLLPPLERGVGLPMLSIPAYSFYYLSTVEYDIRQTENVQTFLLPRIKHPVEGVIVEVEDSWGAPHACLYRIRIHGIGGVITG